ncbi:MAG: 2-C-methyl-D-erythritol 4-phosphate cytidylyltransferase [Bacteroidales bacterium]|nr:2-C-methyl-D-erythritol 4-phosphate cytidylyltransferase [Bacteroidales bacterium]
MDRRIFGIFVAGGSGTRMGSQTPKQFLELGGKPVLQRTIERFLEAVPDMKIITVLPKEHFGTWKELCVRYALDCPQTLVEGGFTRFHSVKNALAKVPDGSIVFIHDGVRPFVSAALIREMASMMQHGQRALVPAIPIVDTLKSKNQEEPDPDRSRLVAVQTPQVFLSEDIKAAYVQGYDTAFTDDASVAKRKKIPLTFVDGERFNIKITTPEDMELAEWLLSR